MAIAIRPSPPTRISLRMLPRDWLSAWAVIAFPAWRPAVVSPVPTAPTACCQATGETGGTVPGRVLWITVSSSSPSDARARGLTAWV